MSLDQQQFLKLNKEDSQQRMSFTQNSSNQNIPSFLLKTYEILQSNKYQEIISWTRSGEGFIVKKVKQFAETVLPVYFRHSKYTSFVRQLNMYDFHKTRQQNQENAFKNFLFKKDQRHLLKQIQRKDYKKNKQTSKQLCSILQKQRVSQPSETQPYGKLKQDTCQAITPQNQCFKVNITELRKCKNQLQEKSLKLMYFKQGELTKQKVMKIIDSLYQCGFATKKAFDQIQVLKTDYQLNERKNIIVDFGYKQKSQGKRTQMSKPQKIQTKLSLRGYKQPITEAKTALFANSQSKAQFSGLEPTQTSLFNSFRNE